MCIISVKLFNPPWLNNIGPGEGLIIGENNCITDWMVIFQVDSTLHLLNNWPRMIFSSLLSTVIQNVLRRQKRQQRNRLTRQNNNFARAAHFFVHFFTVTARLQFCVLKWTQTSQYHIGIIVIEIQRTQIHFLSDVFVAVAIAVSSILFICLPPAQP